MSIAGASRWLYSHHPLKNRVQSGRPARSIAIVSGKGGVGKTSLALKLSRTLSRQGYRVLLIDCDMNLSNTAIKLGLPVDLGLYQLISCQKTFDEVVYKEGSFNLLPACNGSLELFEKKLEWEEFVIDLIHSHEKEYDFIFLDCPAGMGKEVLSFGRHCDYRVVVVTPDKASVADSYSLMKILNRIYKVGKNHLVVNKVSSQDQYVKVSGTISSVVKDFLSAEIEILGSISFVDGHVGLFDRELEKFSNSEIHSQFSYISQKMSVEFFSGEGEYCFARGKI